MAKDPTSDSPWMSCLSAVLYWMENDGEISEGLEVASDTVIVECHGPG